MSRSVLWLFLLTFIATKQSIPDLPIVLKQAESSIASSEDPNARERFEWMQLKDPRNQKIPFNIRQKEVAFAAKIAQKQTKQRSNLEAWYTAGPYNVGGRTRAVAIDKLNEQTLLAGGVSGGVWKSTNGGSTWTRTSDPELHNSVTTLVQDTRPGKEDTWYFGTGELLGNSARLGGAPYRGNGIFKSQDGGDSWYPLSFTQEDNPSSFSSQFQYVYRLVVDHKSENDVILAAVFGAILRSDDGGDTWTTVLGKTLFNLPPDTDLNSVVAPIFTDIVQTPNGNFYAYMSRASNGNQVYFPGGFYWSQDGINWRQMVSASGQTLNRVVMDANDDQMFAFASINNQPLLFHFAFTGVTESGFPLGDWQNRSQNLPTGTEFGDFDIQGGYNMMIKIHPNNPNTVFLGATNLYRSTNGFTTTINTKWIGGYSTDNNGTIYANHHPDQHDVLFYPSNPNRMLSVNDGGLQRTENNLAENVTWSSLNNGYVTSQFYTIDIPKHEPSSTIIGGMQDNGTHINLSSSSNPVWYQLLGGDGGFTKTTPHNLYWYLSFQNSQIYRLTFNQNLGMTSFARVDPTNGAISTGSSYLFINPYVLSPKNPNVMYLAGGNAIWKNTNLAQIPSGSQETTSVNWQNITRNHLTNSTITALELTSKAEYLYYGTGNGELFRLDTPDATMGSPVNLQRENLPSSSYVACIAANPEDANEILVVFSNYGIPSIFHSTDAGDTFVDVSGILEENPDGSGNGPSIRWAEIVPTQTGTRYFVGTSVGLFSTNQLEAGTTEWVKEGTATIGKSVIRMMDYRPLDGTLVVATHGNGVFRTVVGDAKTFAPDTGENPTRFATSKSYPNPFRSVTQIEFDIPKTEYLKVDIYDVNGRLIKNIFLGPQYAGTSIVSWDGTDQWGNPVENGLYIYRIYYDGIIKGGKILYQP